MHCHGPGALGRVLAVCYVNAPVLSAARVHTFRRADIRLASGLWALDIEEALSTNLGLKLLLRHSDIGEDRAWSW